MSDHRSSPISEFEKSVASLRNRWIEKSFLAEGSGMSLEDAESVFAHSMEIYNKPATIVSDWYLVHVETPPEAASPGYDDLKPFVVCALNVFKDTQNRFDKTVRTSQMLSFFDKSIFVTRNTVYLLVGPGRSMQYSDAPEAFSSFFRLLGMRV
ncbi:DUF6957 family protein [Pseudomonas fluorescens]|uniref:DUF6957 family protein n=1 Tax=Pseudomonas fluorescens TaxID=294 RepID=UPI0006997D8D|nr:hypothetical protein [Pseudomonas fluorescens]